MLNIITKKKSKLTFFLLIITNIYLIYVFSTYFLFSKETENYDFYIADIFGLGPMLIYGLLFGFNDGNPEPVSLTYKIYITITTSVLMNYFSYFVGRLISKIYYKLKPKKTADTH
jgi:hypothetical protein